MSFISLLLILIFWGASRLKPGRFSSPAIAPLSRAKAGITPLFLAKAGFIFSIIIITGSALYQTRAQFLLWQGDTISQYLIPPYRGMSYFALYAFTHFWEAFVVSGIVGLICFWVAWVVNRRFGGRFFEDEELYYIALGIFLTGHPGWILYVFIVFIMYVIYSACATVIFHRMERVSFYYFWLPCAAATILASAYMMQFSWYSNLLL